MRLRERREQPPVERGRPENERLMQLDLTISRLLRHGFSSAAIRNPIKSGAPAPTRWFLRLASPSNRPDSVFRADTPAFRSIPFQVFAQHITNQKAVDICAYIIVRIFFLGRAIFPVNPALESCRHSPLLNKNSTPSKTSLEPQDTALAKHLTLSLTSPCLFKPYEESRNGNRG